MDVEPLSTETIDSVVREYANMVYRLTFAQVRSRSDADRKLHALRFFLHQRHKHQRQLAHNIPAAITLENLAGARRHCLRTY